MPIRRPALPAPQPRFPGPAVLLAVLLAGLVAGLVTSTGSLVPPAVAGPPASSSRATEESVLPPGEPPPPTPRSRLAAAGTADDHDGADYLIAYQSSRTRMRARGVTMVEGTTLYKVLTESGANELGVLRFDYEPLSSRIEVRSVTIHRDSTAIPVALDGLRDRPAPQSAIYWGPRIVTLQLPRLWVGDGVEVVTRRKGFTYALLDGESRGAIAADAAGGSNAAEPGVDQPPPAGPGGGDDDARFIPPMEGEYFDIVRFQSHVPTVEMEYTLVLPRDKRLHSEVYNGPLYSATRYSADSTFYTWRGRDLRALPAEPRQPDDSDVAIKVVLATVESWEAKSRWFFDVNRDQFEVSTAVREKVEEIFTERGLKGASEEQKAKALLHWVAQNIRYSGQTMGVGEGYTLHPGTMIFEQRSGVCKDIAGMLITMMRAAGMDSYGAMTMAGSRIEEVPADQFNHCVVALRKDDGRYVMYDPTWAPFNHEIWSKSEAEQHYLIGSPEGERLSRIPYSPPNESPMEFRHDAVLAPDGTLEGTITMKGRGAIDSRLRSFVTSERRRDLRDACAGICAPVSPAVQILECAHLDPLDFEQPMWVRFRYRMPGYALAVGDGLEFRSPMMGIVTTHWVPFRAAAIRWQEERNSDVLLYFTQRFEGEETIRLPGGYRVPEPPEMKPVDETYAMFEGQSETAGGRLTIRAEGELRRRQVPPAGYPGLTRARAAAKEWAEGLYRAEKGGAR